MTSETTRPHRRTKLIVYASSIAAGLLIVLAGYLFYSLTYLFHSYVGFAIAVSLSAPSVLIHFENRRKRLIDNALPRLLDDLAESQDAGMTLLQALEESSRRRYGPITEELKKLTAELSWGVEFGQAFKAFAERIGTELSIRTTTLILEAVRVGGDLKATFGSTAKFVREIIKLREERESQLRAHMIVIYISILIFLVIIVILYESFFVPMEMGTTRFLALPMSLEEYKSLLFDLSLVEAVFGGLIAGKLSQGLVSNGLKHSVLLSLVVTFVFTLIF
jgi:flagellar protein FlaJ